jgi:glycosyltransferase involved in cell wall biosynthesis
MNTIKKELSTCDIIHGQDIAAFPLLNFCKRKGLKVPWVITFHTNPLSHLRLTLASADQGGSPADFATYIAGFPLWDLTVRSHAKFADSLVSVSESLREELCDAYRIDKDRMSVVHNCVNIPRLRKLASDQNNASVRKITLLYAGRLYYGKGILHLLSIVQLLARRLGVSNFNLQVFGRGPLEESLKRYISLNNLEQLVTFRGHVPHSRLLSYMSGSDIICLPSLYESCPILMIEAMGMAKPVVAFYLPFSREILGKERTTLLARDNIDFAQKLAQLIYSEENRTKVGRLLQSDAANFDAPKIASQYREIYTSALK